MKQQLNPNPFFKSLPVNTQGTDYYVGDLHGMFDLLADVLAAVNFDTSKDRLISVGDLIDRGPKSFECLSLLFEPWFFCVLSNHEEMMMHAYNPKASWHNWKLEEAWPQNGGWWCMDNYVAFTRQDMSEERQYQVYQIATEILPKLPLILHVEQENGGFIHVMHAELPKGQHVTANSLRDTEELNRIFNRGIDSLYGTNAMLWGRFRFGDFYKKDLTGKNLEYVLKQTARKTNDVGSSEHLFISGHTICQKPIFIDNFLNIDTGAYLGKEPYSLTLYNSKTETFTQAFRYQNKKGVNFDVEPLVLLNTPQGSE